MLEINKQVKPVISWNSLNHGSLFQIVSTGDIGFKLGGVSLMVFSCDETEETPQVITLSEYGDQVANSDWQDEGFILIDESNYTLTVNL